MRRAVGSNQYRTRAGTDLPVQGAGPNLLDQAAADTFRCGEVWGSECKARVGPPDYSHGNHGVHSRANLVRVKDPDQLWRLVGHRLSPVQWSELAAHHSISLDTLCEMLQSPGAIGPAAAQGLAFRLKGCNIQHPGGVKHMVPPMDNDWSRWLRVVNCWPAGDPQVLDALHAMAFRFPERTWRLMYDDPCWGVWSSQMGSSGVNRDTWCIALGVAHRYRWPDPVAAQLWRRAGLYHGQGSLAEHIKPVLQHGAPETVRVAVGLLRSEDSTLMPHVWEALERDRSPQTIQSIARSVSRLVSSEQQAECAQRLWDAIEFGSHEGPGTQRWRDAVYAIASRFPNSADHIQWAGLQAAVRGFNGRGDAQQLRWSPQLCEMAYSDSHMMDSCTWLREFIMHNRNCPPYILDQEVRSRRRQTAWVAACNPNCPGDAVLWAFQRTDCPDRIRTELLRHPNLPKQYRVLADVMQ